LQTLGLGEEDSAEPALDFPFGDYLGKPRDDQGSPGGPEVRVGTELIDPFGDNPASVRWRRRDNVPSGGRTQHGWSH
jgi:hypothetical protein